MSAPSALRRLAEAALGRAFPRVERLDGGGSTRAFYRLHGEGGTTPVVGVYGDDLGEVRAFLVFTRHLAAHDLPVPTVHAGDPERGLYVMEDLGDVTLAQCLITWREAGDVASAQAALVEAVRWLARFQVRGAQGFDPALCREHPALDAATLRDDVAVFLRRYQPHFAPRATPGLAVTTELDSLLARLDALPRAHFCYRDFQARNIMPTARGLVFFDYQDGRLGHPAYDLASMLYSPDSALDDAGRAELIAAHAEALAEEGTPLSRDELAAALYPMALLRRLQALGAYARIAEDTGNRSFLAKIPPALATLRDMQRQGHLHLGLPHLEGWLADVLARDPETP